MKRKNKIWKGECRTSRKKETIFAENTAAWIVQKNDKYVEPAGKEKLW